MKNILEKIILPKETKNIFETTKVIFPKNREELFKLSIGNDNKSDNFFEVYYTIPRIGKVIECTVAKCKNGIAINYTDSYMRRRDPNCMVIADMIPTDKEIFENRFGESFKKLRNDTIEWFKSLEKIIAMPFMSGGKKFGYPSLLLVPINAAFFAAALSDIQEFISIDELENKFKPRGIMYVAPPFRHTYFQGKQVVVHNRKEDCHEIFSYNLYPGPSAKKGVYSILLDFGEKEGWNTLHASTVQITTPYENTYTIMHEGASGGGKSEMLEQLQRKNDGRILLGEDIVDGERIYVDLNDNSQLKPITDDMALSPPSIQNKKKIVVTDAESGWFLRVDHIKEYGSEPDLEKLTIHPKGPLIFFNIDASPKSTALIWEHINDEPGKPCPNPRVVIPRKYFERTKENDIVDVDLRSFGFRTSPITLNKKGYAVVGLFHILPPAIAWLWRLVAPRGYSNPSVIENSLMGTEGVGSYWPFATGKRVDQANILLKQILNTPETKYALIPNQYIGSYKVDFTAQWLSREYLSRRGQAHFRIDELEDKGFPILGYNMRKVKLDGKVIPIKFLDVSKQKNVGYKNFKEGAIFLTEYFKKELKIYLVSNLNPLGKEIIKEFINDSSLDVLKNLIKTNYIK